jgi:hypothetical protein
MIYLDDPKTALAIVAAILLAVAGLAFFVLRAADDTGVERYDLPPRSARLLEDANQSLPAANEALKRAGRLTQPSGSSGR